MALHLVDHDGLPVQGATVRVALWSPGGELFASLPCVDKGQGQYLAEPVSLPARGARGTWRMVGKATWEDGRQVEVERALEVAPSVSEMYQEKHGFWIEHPRVFGLGTGFYNLSVTGGLHFEDWVYEDGSGCVILDNYRYDALGVTFATLEVHWRHAGFPADEAAAIAHAQATAGAGLHHQDPDTDLAALSAQRSTFQGRPAWSVGGQGHEYYVSKAAAEYPIEWLIFECPGSDWLWSLVLSTDRELYLDHLRTVRDTFECPVVSPDQ